MNSNKFYIIGLDIETSSNDTYLGEIIQIGVAFKNNNEFQTIEYNLFFDLTNWDDKNWSINAEEVHKITKESLALNKYTYDSTEKEIILLLDKTFGENSIIIPVGFNVGSFDLQFIKNKMPNLYNRLSYRSIDLNSLFLFNNLKNYDYNEFISMKKNTKLDIIEDIKESKEHNASFDAKLAILILEKLEKQYFELR